MSSKIQLTISQHQARDDPSVVVTRLLCQAAFGMRPGRFTDFRYAIVDTGAPTSLLPRRAWQDCRVLKLKDYAIPGLVDRPECAMPVLDGVIGCVLTDGHTVSEELTIRAHLAFSNEVPLLLGFSGLLDRADVYFSVDKGEAYLEV